MEIKKLLKYGIPERIIQTWEENQGEKLLPIQSLAVTRFGLLEGGTPANRPGRDGGPRRP